MKKPRKPFIIHAPGGRTYVASNIQTAYLILHTQGGTLKKRPNPADGPANGPWPTIATHPAPTQKETQ